MKLTLYPQGGSANHGCEAIVRSTKYLTGAELEVFSHHPEEDIYYNLEKCCVLHKCPKKINKKSWLYLVAAFRYYILRRKESFDELAFSDIIDNASRSDAFLSIGGDIYCYKMASYFYLVNRMLDKKKIRRILWGASIEPNVIDEVMLNDLKGYETIWARESLTSEALLALGLNNVIVMPDPAFKLKRIDLPLPDGFVSGNTVGINVSPLIMRYEHKAGMTFLNYENLIKYIVEETDMNVALIPHVVWADNDDREPLLQLFRIFSHTGRIVMIDDCNAEELKGYIARCRYMIAARTHASIAAYSQKVPTLVVGYSIKARGIAKDLFGTEDNYVIPVQTLTDPFELKNAFCWMVSHEQMIRSCYDIVIDDYISQITCII